VDQDHGLLRLLGQGSTPRGRCGSCTTAQRVADRPTRNVTDYFDEDVVVITGPEVEGMVVVPRRHITGLEKVTSAFTCSPATQTMRQSQAHVPSEYGSLSPGHPPPLRSGGGLGITYAQ
jgi:hypothetical protein